MNIQAVVVWVLQWRQEVWRWGAQWPAIRSWQWPTENIIEADPLIIIGEVAEELNISHSVVIWHLKQIGKMKKLDKWVPHELTKIPKNWRFEGSSSLILWNNNEPFLNQMVTYDKKCFFIWQTVMTSSVVRPRRRSKHFPKPNSHPKRVKVVVWWSAVHMIHYSFLNSGETITYEKYVQQINETHQEMQCLQQAMINRRGPILLHDIAWPHVAQSTLQKLNQLG